MASDGLTGGCATGTESDSGQAILNVEVIGAFCNAVSASRHQLRHAVKNITDEFDLGPRGPWIIGIIGKRPCSPHQLADFLAVGRSMITAELARLLQAGLITQTRVADDARRSLITLTPAGNRVMARVGAELGAFLSRRLAGYTREEVMLCARLLTAFATDKAP